MWVLYYPQFIVFHEGALHSTHSQPHIRTPPVVQYRIVTFHQIGVKMQHHFVAPFWCHCKRNTRCWEVFQFLVFYFSSFTFFSFFLQPVLQRTTTSDGFKRSTWIWNTGTGFSSIYVSPVEWRMSRILTLLHKSKDISEVFAIGSWQVRDVINNAILTQIDIYK